MCINVANSNKYLGYHIGLFQGRKMPYMIYFAGNITIIVYIV